MIWLVGLGWASDDPVRAYTIMSDNHDTRGEFNHDGGCVRMWIGAIDPLNRPKWCGSNPSKTYRLNRALCSGTECDRAALYTDYLSIGARLCASRQNSPANMRRLICAGVRGRIEKNFVALSNSRLQ